MKAHLRALAATAREHIPDALLVGGASAVTCGVALIYAPAGWIVGGLFALAAGVYTARSAG